VVKLRQFSSFDGSDIESARDESSEELIVDEIEKAGV
jgi:hypothetical protein